MKATDKGNTKEERGGDTSRSSSQGRKLTSGGKQGKRGNPQMNEATHSPVRDEKAAAKEENREEKKEGS